MAQGGGQSGGMGAPMGGQGMGAPMGSGMQSPMSSVNTTTQQNITGGPGGMGQPMGGFGQMGGGMQGFGQMPNQGMGQPMGGFGGDMDGPARMPIQGGMPQTQNTIPGRSDFSGFDGMGGMGQPMGGNAGGQNLMQVLQSLGFTGMGGGIPQMQNPFSQSQTAQPAISAPTAATQQAQPAIPAPAARPIVQPQPSVPPQISGEQARAQQMQSRAQQRRADRLARRSRGAPAPTDFSQMGQAGQFGTQGFAQGLQDYLGKEYAGYGYNPTNQTFYQGADRGGQSLSLDQALQRGRAAGFQMASGGITSLTRRR